MLPHVVLNRSTLPWEGTADARGHLPTNSICFFQVNRYWLRCLPEDAISPVRFLSTDHHHDQALHRALDQVQLPVSGVLLRSEIVTADPDLIVEGGGGANGKWGVPATVHRPAPGIMLATFDRAVRWVTVHLAPEALHCGVEPNLKRKQVRAASGKPSSAHVDVGPIPERVIAVKAVADRLSAKAEEIGFKNSGGAGLFALQMIQGVRHVRFELQ